MGQITGKNISCGYELLAKVWITARLRFMRALDAILDELTQIWCTSRSAKSCPTSPSVTATKPGSLLYFHGQIRGKILASRGWELLRRCAFLHVFVSYVHSACARLQINISRNLSGHVGTGLYTDWEPKTFRSCNTPGYQCAIVTPALQSLTSYLLFEFSRCFMFMFFDKLILAWI